MCPGSLSRRSATTLWLLLIVIVVSPCVLLHLIWTSNDVNKDIIFSRDTNQEFNSTITKRDTWNDAIYRGNWLLCIMNAPARTIHQSPWIVYNGLNLHGWTSTTQTIKSQDALDTFGLRSAFEALGIDTDYRQWVTVSDGHDTSKGSWQATMGKYLNTFSKKDGVIVARNNYSPDYYAARKGIPKERVPPLKQWSDVVYLEWLRLAGRDRGALRNIHHVFRYNIANMKTQETLRLAMGDGNVDDAPETPGEWPGTQFSIAQDSAKVALTTSNSVGVAYFLAQHKEQLGVRVVDQINVFNCKTGPADQWCLYFHISEGPLGGGNMN